MFSYIYEIRYGDYKNFDVIKPAVILDIVQDISIKHSHECGYGLQKLKDMNMAWMLQGIKVHFLKPISINFAIKANTAVKTMKSVTSNRGCILEQNGEVVAKTIANWFIFDFKEMNTGKIPKDMAEAYKCYDFEDEFFVYKKPKLHQIDNTAYTIRISNRDIDTNKHLNNQKAAELLMDALPFDFYFTDMNIIFKKSAYLGDKLEVCIKEIENGYYVHLQTLEKEICVAGTFTINADD